MRNHVINEYFNWLSDLVNEKRHSKHSSYGKLLMRLHDTEFIYVIPNDRNRADDGVDMRYRFILENGYDEFYDETMDALRGPCSVLEMMVALAIRCEENIMDDPAIGNRTAQWFWMMITNLGLGSMTDARFDKRFVDDKLRTFLNREYRPDGRGGLFTVKDCDRDLRDLEIWFQLCRFLDTIT